LHSGDFFLFLVFFIVEGFAAFGSYVSSTKGFRVDFTDDDSAETETNSTTYPECLAISDTGKE
jgi:hypothetical protein